MTTIKRDGILMHYTTWMNLANMTLSEKRPIIKGHTFYDSIYMNSSE